MWQWFQQLVRRIGPAETVALDPPEPGPLLSDEDLAVRADALAQEGDPRGILINAELAGLAGPALDRLYAEHLDCVLGGMTGLLQPYELRHGAPVRAFLRRKPNPEERQNPVWLGLEAQSPYLGRMPPRFVGVRWLGGVDRDVWLAYDRELDCPTVVALPEEINPVSRVPPWALQSLDRVPGAEIYPVDLEPLPVWPWDAEIRAAVAAAVQSPEAHPNIASQCFLLNGQIVQIGDPRLSADLKDERQRRWSLPQGAWAGAQTVASRGGCVTLAVSHGVFAILRASSETLVAQALREFHRVMSVPEAIALLQRAPYPVGAIIAGHGRVATVRSDMRAYTVDGPVQMDASGTHVAGRVLLATESLEKLVPDVHRLLQGSVRGAAVRIRREASRLPGENAAWLVFDSQSER